jgi:hypothetical protein
MQVNKKTPVFLTRAFLFCSLTRQHSIFSIAELIRMRGKPRPSDLVAKQPLGKAVELGRGRIARTPQASLPCSIPASVAARCTAEQC